MNSWNPRVPFHEGVFGDLFERWQGTFRKKKNDQALPARPEIRAERERNANTGFNDQRDTDRILFNVEIVSHRSLEIGDRSFVIFTCTFPRKKPRKRMTGINNSLFPARNNTCRSCEKLARTKFFVLHWNGRRHWGRSLVRGTTFTIFSIFLSNLYQLFQTSFDASKSLLPFFFSNIFKICLKTFVEFV